MHLSTLFLSPCSRFLSEVPQPAVAGRHATAAPYADSDSYRWFSKMEKAHWFYMDHLVPASRSLVRLLLVLFWDMLLF